MLPPTPPAKSPATPAFANPMSIFNAHHYRTQPHFLMWSPFALFSFCLPLAPCSVFLLVSFSSSSFFLLSSHSFSLSLGLFLLFWSFKRICPWSLSMFFSLCALPGWSPLYPRLQGRPWGLPKLHLQFCLSCELLNHMSFISIWMSHRHFKPNTA